MPRWSRITLRYLLSLIWLIISQWLWLLLLFPANSQLAQAQTTQTDTENVAVSATVPDNQAPSTPILIAPSNNSYLTTNTPTFIWEECTDDRGMDHYELYLNGSLHFNNIPLVDTDNSQFTLDYDAGTGRYSLTPKTSLADATYTWKIRAVDLLDNYADSVTWTFTVDTLAPNFTLTQIGSETVSISAQDASTVPSEPIELTTNEPLLVANGEANSTVVLVVTIPGDPNQTHTTTINGSGNWSKQLGILPRDVVIVLDFTITDQAGHVSVLNDVPFIIRTQYFFQPTQTPVPSPTPTLHPLVTPSPTPLIALTPTLSPTPAKPPLPLPSIPAIPPKEIVHEVVQEISERMPPSITTALTQAPEVIKKVFNQTLKTLAPVANLVLVTAIPAIGLISLLLQFGSRLSLDFLTKLLQIIGLLPLGKPQGVVFDSETYQPVPFALLTFYQHQQGQDVLIGETVVTDDQGIYQGVQLPPGEYRLTVQHQDYLFPSQKKRPAHLSIKDYYLGEVFTIDSTEKQQFFLIPMDAVNPASRYSIKTRARLALTRLARFNHHLIWPLFIISGALAIIFRSLWNTIVFILYSLALAKRAQTWFSVADITGLVVDQQGQPIKQAIVKLSKAQTNRVTAVTSSDQDGKFSFRDQQGKYQLQAYKQGWQEVTDQPAMVLSELNTTQEPQQAVVVMKKVLEAVS
ncbi:MAG: hypothetical protein GF390_02115 [Candidatus Pacebacteria bacterium]|nr:hypothetical protein [Candidatus Paceibacterota bacterium]